MKLPRSLAVAATATLVVGFGAAACGAGSTSAGAPATPRVGSPATTPAMSQASAVTSGRATRPPRPGHTLVLVMENHSRNDIIGNPSAPYINSLAAKGAMFSRSFAVSHPSEPNYLALFSGSTQGIASDACPVQFHGPNLASDLRSAHLHFAGFSESLPSVGFTGCSSGSYARKHNPWVDFGALPTSINRPLSALPSHFAHLPNVSFVVPNLQHDMHDGTIAQGDHWVRRHIGGYIRAARKHHGLVVITWDEDDYSQGNQIPTIFLGGNVKPGVYRERIDHYSVLRTIEAAYHVPAIGESANRSPITNVWKRHP